MMKMESRFSALFEGNKRSRGVYLPEKDRGFTDKEPATEAHFRAHLHGEQGVGIVPIQDSHDCIWGAIDIDSHGDDEPDIDLDALQEIINENELPLVVCRSKSGGAHVYLFLEDPTPAKVVKSTLATWAALLGYAGCEIFPKQADLPGDGEDRQLGNWINLPYFNALDTNRYAINKTGNILDVGGFLDLAEEQKCSPGFLLEKLHGVHAEAPPCIQTMIKDGVPGGSRNEAVYNLTIYLKRAFPDDYRKRMRDLNTRIFAKPLDATEINKTIDSASRRQYQYKCQEEPCKSRCNSAVCVKRRFGIDESDKDELDMAAEPAKFTKIERMNTDPVRWYLHEERGRVMLQSGELMSFKLVQQACLEQLCCVIAPMKNPQWLGVVNALLMDVTHIDAPEDASTKGIMRARLDSFMARCDLSDDGKNPDLQLLLLGNPVVAQEEGQRVVFFRGSDFIEFLKKSRGEDLKGSNLWAAMRECGVGHKRKKIKGQSIPVWYVLLADDQSIQLDVVDMEPEL